jgi:AraC-like DNA-binding protein
MRKVPDARPDSIQRALAMSSLPPAVVPFAEAAIWAAVPGRWQPLFGGFATLGVSVEWHDLQPAADLDWGRSFHPGSLEICLNFSGIAHFADGGAERELVAGQVAIYTALAAGPRAVRRAGSLHRFLTVEITPDFLRSQCSGQLDLLKAPLRRFVRDGQGCPPFLEVAPLGTSLLALRADFVEPPVPQAARAAWYRAKVLEVLAQTVFRADAPGEFFCAKHQRQNRERVERARYLLERDLENPPSLEMLAQDVECSPFHLSRIFTEAHGMSIPRFLRTRRIEKAAELLRSGKMNVTEAAFAVGYASLSAFNRAFVEQMGCCPGLYPRVRIAGRKAVK